ncbi:MAG: hypothetical protein JWL63_2448 [Rhodocyclales bacterium]|nr:hypothetical protein [Rhodocyclales bacterium]
MPNITNTILVQVSTSALGIASLTPTYIFPTCK